MFIGLDRQLERPQDRRFEPWCEIARPGHHRLPPCRRLGYHGSVHHLPVPSLQALEEKVGAGKTVKWPAAASVGGKGNAGVAANVSKIKGSLGYVEYAYAKKNIFL